MAPHNILWPLRSLLFAAAFAIAGVAVARAAEPPAAAASAGSDALAAEQKARFTAFENDLKNVTLAGHFTLGEPEGAKLHEERYVISSVAKLPTGDLWLINARVKYGDKDLTLPMPLEVKWAGKTPVITLDNVSLPGLGTFSARVIIDGNKYAGTWTHDKLGGHLFGRIEKNAAAGPDAAEKK